MDKKDKREPEGEYDLYEERLTTVLLAVCSLFTILLALIILICL